jgi:hypothetical protein
MRPKLTRQPRPAFEQGLGYAWRREKSCPTPSEYWTVLNSQGVEL